MDATIVEVELPNGAIALVQARDLDGDGATKTLEGVSESIRKAVAKAAPTKVTVELGLEMAVTSGALVGLIVDGETTASPNGEPDP